MDRSKLITRAMAVKAFGSTRRLANALNVAPGTIRNMDGEDTLPMPAQWILSIAVMPWAFVETREALLAEYPAWRGENDPRIPRYDRSERA